MILLSGNSNQLLANHISNHAGIALTEMKLTRFSDGEIFCEIFRMFVEKMFLLYKALATLQTTI